MSHFATRVLSSALFLVLGFALLVHPQISGGLHTHALAVALALTGVCAFLHPPIRTAASTIHGGSLASLGPAWLRIVLGVAACAFALAAFVLRS